jgi:uncharacterized protein with HEPN domain
MPSEIDRLSQNLLDIVENVEAALRFVKGVTKEEFVSDQMRRYAAVRALEIISEASRRVPEDIAALYPDIPWRKVRDAGNVYRHVYREVDLGIVGSP